MCEMVSFSTPWLVWQRGASRSPIIVIACGISERYLVSEINPSCSVLLPVLSSRVNGKDQDFWRAQLHLHQNR